MFKNIIIGFLLWSNLFFVNIVFSSDDNWDEINFSSQAQFDNFAKDLGGSLSFSAMGPAAPLGVLGFDISAGVSAISFKEGYLDKVGAKSSDTIVFSKVMAQKGLPFGFDVGLSQSRALNSNVVKTGGFISYAILKGGIVMPALNLRLAMSKLSNVDVLEFSSKTLEASISKGFTIITPYVGAGVVSSNTKATSTNKGGVILKESDNTQAKYFAGISMNMLFMNILLQHTTIGDATSTGAKLGIRF
jgi:hypothetical protein